MHTRVSLGKRFVTRNAYFIVALLLAVGTIVVVIVIIRHWSFLCKPIVGTDKGKSYLELLASPSVQFLGAIGAAGFFGFNYYQKNQQFALETFEKQFVDIQNRFANNDSPMMRASAAHRLAEMATRARLGKPEVLSETNYPYFLRAATQLTTALHLEKESAVRSAIQEALKELMRFGQGSPDAFAYPLLDRLMTANRVAKRTFVNALTAYLAECAPLTSSEDLQIKGAKHCCVLLRDVIPLWGETDKDKYLNIRFVQDFLDKEGCLQHLGILYSDVGPAGAPIPETVPGPKSDVGKEVRQRAACLLDTIPMVAAALRMIGTSYPKTHRIGRSPLGEKAAARTTEFGMLNREAHRIDLTGCFLQNIELGRTKDNRSADSSELQDVVLHNADFSASYLYAADLRHCELIACDLSMARMIGSSLQGSRIASDCRFNQSSLDDCDASNADFSGVRFEATFFKGSNLEEANLCETNFIACEMGNADLHKAKLRKAILNNVSLGIQNLGTAEWSGAIFKDCYSPRTASETARGRSTVSTVQSEHPTTWKGAVISVSKRDAVDKPVAKSVSSETEPKPDSVDELVAWLDSTERQNKFDTKAMPTAADSPDRPIKRGGRGPATSAPSSDTVETVLSLVGRDNKERSF